MDDKPLTTPPSVPSQAGAELPGVPSVSDDALPAARWTTAVQRAAPLALVVAVSGLAGPVAAAPDSAWDEPAGRLALNARVQAVRLSLAQREGAAASHSGPELPAAAKDLPVQAAPWANWSNWSNWPKWSKWSNWANA